MSKLEIRLELPGGKLPEGADVVGFQTRVTKELKAFAERVPNAKVRSPETTDAPEGTAGLGEITYWIAEFAVEHPEEAKAILAALITAISTAVSLFKIRKKSAAGKQQKGSQTNVKAKNSTVSVTNVTVNIDGDAVVLPATSQEIERVVSAALKSTRSASGGAE